MNKDGSLLVLREPMSYEVDDHDAVIRHLPIQGPAQSVHVPWLRHSCASHGGSAADVGGQHVDHLTHI